MLMLFWILGCCPLTNQKNGALFAGPVSQGGDRWEWQVTFEKRLLSMWEKPVLSQNPVIFLLFILLEVGPTRAYARHRAHKLEALEAANTRGDTSLLLSVAEAVWTDYYPSVRNSFLHFRVASEIPLFIRQHDWGIWPLHLDHQLDLPRWERGEPLQPRQVQQPRLQPAEKDLPAQK